MRIETTAGNSTARGMRHPNPHTRMQRRLAKGMVILLSLALAAPASHAAELRAATIAAFERYARLTEERILREAAQTGPFLWMDTLPEAQRQAVLAQVREGKVWVEKLRTLENAKEIEIPDGLIHHWIGVSFVPGKTAKQAWEEVLDYGRHARRYAPDVESSRLLGRDGDLYRSGMRFRKKKVITVVTDCEFEARLFILTGQRAHVVSHSTRIQEVENAGTRNERLLPAGKDGGYLWRLFTYWRFEEKDGGTYVQCETITLTRGIPGIVAWIVRGFVESVPRESLTFTMEKTRAALDARTAPAANQR